MRVLAAEGVALDAMFAHGGIFRTEGVAQRLLAAAIGAPVTVGRTAGEGGAWGIAVLAAYARSVAGGHEQDLDTYLREHVFATAELDAVEPDADGRRGLRRLPRPLRRGPRGRARAAVDAL